MTRREFGLVLPAASGALVTGAGKLTAEMTDSDIGSLYPFVQKQADRSPIDLSFLRPEFHDLKQWQQRARAKVLELMFYAPPAVDPQPQLIRRTDRGDHIEEYLTLQTTPDLRAPAYLLIPKGAKLPAPGVVALHDHGAFYLWGKEKLLQLEDEHPVLTRYRQDLYSGKSIARELVRRGYVVIVIDMFYWGERRMILDDDPSDFQQRPSTMPEEQIDKFNQRSQQHEELVARSLFTAGITWPGVMVWDDIRTVDYLCQRPEVDKRRLACVGLSVGGYRSMMLAALDERIQTAVSVGFMKSDRYQIKRNVIHSTGFTFHIVGLLHYLDFPDLSALIAPRAALFINGSRDTLFNQAGLRAAYKKIQQCYEKAGADDRQICRMYDTTHMFNARMQAEAWEWMAKWL